MRTALVVALFAVYLVSRVIIWDRLEFEIDEVWTIRQTFGTPVQVLLWTPYDWPPLHYLALHAWQRLVGFHPFVTRLSSVYIGLVALAAMYRLARRWFGATAAVLTMAALGGFGYSLYLTTAVRGYVALLALFPPALLFTDAYFRRPGWRWALPLAVCLAALFYTHLTSVLMLAVIGLYSLMFFTRQVWRWWLPGILAGVLVLPEVLRKLRIVTSRLTVTQQIDLGPFVEAVGGLYRDLFGSAAVVWMVVLVVGLILALRVTQRRTLAVFLAVWCAGPVVMYLLNPLLGFFLPRHQTWILPGFALLIGWGLSRLARPLQIVFIGFCCVSMFLPMLPYRQNYARAPFMATFPWLSSHVRGGDVFYRDPNLTTGEPEEWDYFTRVYFPRGLPLVDDPTPYRRVWYVSVDGRQNTAAFERIRTGRIAREFIGPWDFLFRLYEAPPDRTGVLFPNGMRFHGAEHVTNVTPRVYLEGEQVTLRLWWSVDSPPPLDYSVSVQMLDATGVAVRQLDGPPQPVDLPVETSRWIPGQFYVEDREFTLPESMSTGAYPVFLAVYHFSDQKRLPAAGVNAEGLLLITTVYVKAW